MHYMAHAQSKLFPLVIKIHFIFGCFLCVHVLYLILADASLANVYIAYLLGAVHFAIVFKICDEPLMFETAGHPNQFGSHICICSPNQYTYIFATNRN